jgi:hypothetical protein
MATKPTTKNVADFFKANMDFQRFARLTKALGSQLNDAQLRFLKAMVFEQSVEEYSNGKIKYVGEEGCDFVIPSLNDVRIEMKYNEGALYTSSRKILREETGTIKLMNSMGTNTHKTLPASYADYLIFVGNQGAALFDKNTVKDSINPQGDGLIANIKTAKGIILSTPAQMNSGTQQEIDFIQGLKSYIKTYINSVK